MRFNMFRTTNGRRAVARRLSPVIAAQRLYGQLSAEQRRTLMKLLVLAGSVGFVAVGFSGLDAYFRHRGELQRQEWIAAHDRVNDQCARDGFPAARFVPGPAPDSVADREWAGYLEGRWQIGLIMAGCNPDLTVLFGLRE